MHCHVTLPEYLCIHTRCLKLTAKAPKPLKIRHAPRSNCFSIAMLLFRFVYTVLVLVIFWALPVSPAFLSSMHPPGADLIVATVGRVYDFVKAGVINLEELLVANHRWKNLKKHVALSKGVLQTFKQRVFFRKACLVCDDWTSSCFFQVWPPFPPPRFIGILPQTKWSWSWWWLSLGRGTTIRKSDETPS